MFIHEFVHAINDERLNIQRMFVSVLVNLSLARIIERNAYDDDVSANAIRTIWRQWYHWVQKSAR